jgi:hypothetical protein
MYQTISLAEFLANNRIFKVPSLKGVPHGKQAGKFISHHEKDNYQNVDGT